MATVRYATMRRPGSPSPAAGWDVGANGVPHNLVQVTQGGHEFDTVGESPSETGIIRLVVDFFVRTLVFHRPITSN